MRRSPVMRSIVAAIMLIPSLLPLRSLVLCTHSDGHVAIQIGTGHGAAEHAHAHDTESHGHHATTDGHAHDHAHAHDDEHVLGSDEPGGLALDDRYGLEGVHTTKFDYLAELAVYEEDSDEHVHAEHHVDVAVSDEHAHTHDTEHAHDTAHHHHSHDGNHILGHDHRCSDRPLELDAAQLLASVILTAPGRAAIGQDASAGATSTARHAALARAARAPPDLLDRRINTIVLLI